jgi:hypothetical protein
LTPTYSEVIYETQPSFVVHECAGHCGLREAAVDLARCTGRFEYHGPSRSGGFFELDHEHASSRGSVQPARDAAAGHQRLCDATASG